MRLINCETDYRSVSCNRYSHCIDCKQKYVCFAAHHSIAIYNIEEYKIVKLLNGHKSQVNSVRWIGNEDKLIVSSSSDNSCIIWRIINEKFDYVILYKLIGHNQSVIISDAIYFNNDICCVTTSTDNTLRVWKNDNQMICYDITNFILDIKVCNYSIFPNIVIITGGTDEVIRFYEWNNNINQLNVLTTIRGHEDWIRSIDCFYTNNDTLFVASSSQDFFIRVYKIEKTDNSDIHKPRRDFTFNINTDGIDNNYIVNLETILAGHDGWVNDICWYYSDNSLQLLSASMDKTLVLWQPPNNDSLDDVWTESARMGEVGGNSLGFLGCACAPQYNFILGYSFNGSLHVWKYTGDRWNSFVTVGGHFDEVTDIAFDPKGEYLLSCSKDQTTRLHSIWFKSNTWHETARTQIHGYDLKSIAMIDRLSFASAADEKVIRLFIAPKYFIESAKQISNINFELNENHKVDVAECASVPSLGLSNQAIYEISQIDHDFKPTILNCPPTEEMLLQNTLWPETQKLYGHGYELFSIACNHSATVLASACKASKAEHAYVIVWSVKDAKQITELHSHQLTVTQIEFSPNDQYLLTVSRDRTWALFNLIDNNYHRLAYSDKKTCIHSRIIWSCSWTPDNNYFITVSRDKKAVLWRISEDNTVDSTSSLGCVKPYDCVLTLDDSITAVNILNHILLNGQYLIAFGLENGQICLYTWNINSFWSYVSNIDDCHQQTINRIRFSPINDYKENLSIIRFASCSTDHSIKIFSISITN